MEKDFEEWYDAFVEFLRIGGYQGYIDKDSAHRDFDNQIDAMEAANQLIEEMNNYLED